MTYGRNNLHTLTIVFVICGYIPFVSSQECIRATTENLYVERERTFLMIKPDGVQRGLVGEIVKRFEQKGLKLIGLKFKWVRSFLLRIFLR